MADGVKNASIIFSGQRSAKGLSIRLHKHHNFQPLPSALSPRCQLMENGIRQLSGKELQATAKHMRQQSQQSEDGNKAEDGDEDDDDEARQ
ncbi:hypothetical protein ACLKA7_013084 [Drosophila subpalustris]